MLTLAVGAFVSMGLNARKSHDAALSRNLSILNAVVKQVEQNYVDTVDPNASIKAAIGAYLANTDPYTEYYDSQEQDKLLKMSTGEYGGIGSYIMERNGKSYISEPFAGSPAATAGLKAGDHILKVDTTEVSNKGSEVVTKLLKGIPGTHVRVTVQRPYAKDSIQTFDITRGKLQDPSVVYDTIISDVGYIRLSQFIDKTPGEVAKVFNGFKEHKGLKGIVIDLRSNGGGVLDSGVDLVSNFVPKGTEVLRTVGRNSSQDRIYKTPRKPMFPDTPVVVLIDGGTASASEIVAGSLQDLDRAVLIGSRSFGKGLVQSSASLPYGGLLKVTVAKYYLPSGRLIQAMDYSRRNPDGTVARVPDSLTNVYHTRGGREVRDGGGLRPDSTVDWGKVNRLVYNVVSDNWAFDYATRYAATHPTIPAPHEFEITDEIFEDFKKSIDPKRFKYDKVCEDMVKQIRATVEAEGYMNDETKAQIDKLSSLLVHDLDHDLDLNRKQISEYLGNEIVGRYYYNRGKTAYDLKEDEGLKLAIQLLNNPQEYNKILGKK